MAGFAETMSDPDQPLECWHCGTTLRDVPLPLSRHANCPKCFEELHCCRMCRHWRPARATGCDEDRADVPARREAANFCEWFVARPGAHASNSGPEPASARAKLTALFGGADEPAPDPADDARARLEALFGTPDASRRKD